MIVSNVNEVRKIYGEAAERGWVLPCFCSENLTTTESIFAAAYEFGRDRGIDGVPITVAITCNYPHRPQVLNYTNTGDWATGLRLFMSDIKALTCPGAPYEKLRVMVHLDHIQNDLDIGLYTSDLSEYSSIMFDASKMPFEENIRLTAEFVKEKGGEIYIEGACDEIMDATGSEHNDITLPKNALRYLRETGVDMIVANLGTEHRATGKELKYHGDAAKKIKELIGAKIVLHGTSSVSNEQVKKLYGDGVCKVNIWTALERDSAPILFGDMVKNAEAVAGGGAVRRLIGEGYLTEKCAWGGKPDIGHFTSVSRGRIVFGEMKRIVREYLDMWYI